MGFILPEAEVKRMRRLQIKRMLFLMVFITAGSMWAVMVITHSVPWTPWFLGLLAGFLIGALGVRAYHKIGPPVPRVDKYIPAEPIKQWNEESFQRGHRQPYLVKG
jgi:hypothetical protein